MQNQGFSREARVWSQFPPCTKGIKLLFYLYISEQHTRVPTSSDLISRPVQGCKVSRMLDFLELQSRFGDNPLKFQVLFPHLSPKRDCSPKTRFWKDLLSSFCDGVTHPLYRNVYTRMRIVRMVAHSSLQIPDIPVDESYVVVYRNVGIYPQANPAWLSTTLREDSMEQFRHSLCLQNIRL